MKNKIKNIIFIVILFTLIACSRSLFINKNVYSIYKMPVIEKANEKSNLKTDGYYLEIENPKKRISGPEAIIILKNGYVAQFYDFKSEIENKLKSNQNLNVEMAWYSLKKDSIIIEYFGENPNEIATYSFKYYGNINGDSLSLSYENSNEIKYYKFIKDSNLPKLINVSRYVDKKWYRENLHYSRK